MNRLLKALTATALIGGVLTSYSATAETKKSETVKSPSHFTFIHSAWMGGWQWNALTPLLEKKGASVTTLDLPGHGEDKTAPADITLQDYVNTVEKTLNQSTGKTILVAHSFGGVVASQVAEKFPEKIDAIVYLCAAMLPNGASFMDAASQIKTSKVLNNLIFSKDGASVTIAKNVLHDAVAHDVPKESFTKAKPNLVAEPTAPLKAKLSLSDARYGKLPKYYIECTKDQGLPIEAQRAMQKSEKLEHVYTLATSHVPMFSNPKGVADALTDMAAREYVRHATEKASQGWKAAFNAGDAKAAAGFYESDAIMIAKPFGTFKGHSKIEAFWTDLIGKGAKNVEYFDTELTVLDATSARIRSNWRMNVASGVITNEHWVLQEDGKMLLREDHFEAKKE